MAAGGIRLSLTDESLNPRLPSVALASSPRCFFEGTLDPRERENASASERNLSRILGRSGREVALFPPFTVNHPCRTNFARSPFDNGTRFASNRQDRSNVEAIGRARSRGSLFAEYFDRREISDRRAFEASREGEPSIRGFPAKAATAASSPGTGEEKRKYLVRGTSFPTGG